jgi:hypothetical protein
MFSRHGVIVIVALLCFIPGLFIGAVIGSNLYPNYYLKGLDHDSEKDAVQAIAIGCGIAGSLVGGAALAIATRKRIPMPKP